ncbi:MAG: hypothetical protein ACOCXH_04410 [Cyclobacteriaceae bacterium]
MENKQLNIFDVKPQYLDRSCGKPLFALYSKNRNEKDAFVEHIRAIHKGKSILYVCPKVIHPYLQKRFPFATVVPMEHFDKSNIFLTLEQTTDHNTVLILENTSRYVKIDSHKFRYMHRLRKKTKFRYVIDIVPFTKDIVKLYLPYSYLDREILQYSNGYAFEFNYIEEDEDGNKHRAHDHDFLSKKILPWSHITYDNYLPENIKVISSELTVDEHKAYERRKEELFAKYKHPGRIVTYICDFANMVHSRYDSLTQLLESLTGHTVVFTNIVKNNTFIKKHLKTKSVKYDIEFKTYYTHNNKPIDAENVILFETPINNTYFMHDVIADIRQGTNTFYFKNNAKADIYIYGIMSKELNSIHRFTKILKAKQDEMLY